MTVKSQNHQIGFCRLSDAREIHESEYIMEYHETWHLASMSEVQVTTSGVGETFWVDVWWLPLRLFPGGLFFLGSFNCWRPPRLAAAFDESFPRSSAAFDSSWSWSDDLSSCDATDLTEIQTNIFTPSPLNIQHFHLFYLFKFILCNIA